MRWRWSLGSSAASFACSFSSWLLAVAVAGVCVSVGVCVSASGSGSGAFDDDDDDDDDDAGGEAVCSPEAGLGFGMSSAGAESRLWICCTRLGKPGHVCRVRVTEGRMRDCEVEAELVEAEVGDEELMMDT